MIKIAPSILSADFSKLGEEIKRIEMAGAEYVHIDVMDGRFVPNITIGPLVVKALRPISGLLFDVHLMIEDPEKYIDDFIDAGADLVSVHVEACKHLQGTLQKIRKKGAKSAVALNPATSISTVEWVLQDVDMILLMTVNPGFGGQSYIESMTDKIRNLKNLINLKGYNIDIQVDGGIDLGNIYKVTEAGANIIVSGSTIFKSNNMSDIVSEFKKRAYL